MPPWSLAAVALTFVGGVALAISLADDGATTTDPAPTSPIVAAQLAGHEFAWTSSAGAVHVWVPAGYHADGAALVFYVHGYGIDVDHAWIEHRLPEQFASSAVNAVFVAIEAPSGARQPVSWPVLADAIHEVFSHVEVARPVGAIVAIGHSGGYRTLLAWLDDPTLDWVIQLDSTYGEVEAWQAWMASSSNHHLIFVGDDTIRWTEELADGLAPTLGAALVTLDRFGDHDALPEPDLRSARAIYIRSQYSHMAIVTGGLAIPALLRMTPVEILADGPWATPLGLAPRLDAGQDSSGP
jgi:hypothetical protein